DVRRTDKIWKRQQFCIGRRLRLEDVTAGARERFVEEGRFQRGFVDDSTAGRVDQKGGRLHPRQLARPNGATSTLIERNVNRKEVRFLKQRIETDGGHAGFSKEIVVRQDVVSDDTRAERTGKARDRLADIAAAKDADRGRRELPASTWRPGACAEIV